MLIHVWPVLGVSRTRSDRHHACTIAILAPHNIGIRKRRKRIGRVVVFGERMDALTARRHEVTMCDCMYRRLEVYMQYMYIVNGRRLAGEDC